MFKIDYQDQFSALSLDWIAVRSDLRGNKLGEHLMGTVISDFYNCIEEYCLPALVLEAIDQRTEGFYHRLGFRRYGPAVWPQRRMVIGAKPVVELNKMLANGAQHAEGPGAG